MGEDELKIRLAIETAISDTGLDLANEKVKQFEQSLKQTFGSTSMLAESATRSGDRIKDLTKAFQKAQIIKAQLIPLDEKYTDALMLLNKEKLLLKDFNDREQKDLNKIFELSSKLLDIQKEYPELYEKSADGVSGFSEKLRFNYNSMLIANEKQEEFDENLEKLNEKLELAGKYTRIFGNIAKNAFVIAGSESDNAKAAIEIFTTGLKPLGMAWDTAKKKMKNFFAKHQGLFGKAASGIKTKIGNLVKNMGGKLFSVFKTPKPSEFAKTGAGVSSLGKTGTLAGGRLGKLGIIFSRMGGGLARLAPMAAAAGGSFVAMGAVAVVAAAAIAALVAVLVSLATVLAMVVVGFKLQIETMEAFRTANYRALGSIKDLSGASFELMRDLGLTNKEAIASIQALSKAGFTAEGLAKSFKTADGQTLGYKRSLALLARTNAAFTKATGISADVTAAFQKRMDAIGFGAPKVKGMLDLAAGAMKKYGMTADEVSAVLSKIKDQSLGLETLWGAGSSEAFGELQFAASGLAKELGIPVGQMQDFMNLVGNANSGMAMLVRSQLGVEPSRDMKEFALQAAQATKSWQQVASTQGIGLDIQKELLEAWGLNVQQIGAGVKLYEKYGRAGSEAFGKTISEMKEQGELMSAMSESMETLPQRLNQLFGPILYMASELAGPLLEGIIQGFEEVLGVTLQLSGSKGFEGLKETIKSFVPLVREWGVLLVKFAVQFMKAVFGIARAVMPILIGFMKIISPLIKAATWVVEKAEKVAGFLSSSGGQTEKKMKRSSDHMAHMNKLFKDMDRLSQKTQKSLSGMGGAQEKSARFAERANAAARATGAAATGAEERKIIRQVASGAIGSAVVEQRVISAVDEIRARPRRQTIAPNFTVQFTEATAKTNEHLLDLIACCASLGDIAAVIRDNQLSKEEIGNIIELFRKIADNNSNEALDPWRRPGGIGGRGEANTEWIRRFS